MQQHARRSHRKLLQDSDPAQAAFNSVMSPTAVITTNSVVTTATPAGADVLLDATRSTPNWGTALQDYSWQLTRAGMPGDERAATGQITSVKLPPGTWDVQLSIKDSSGAVGTDSMTVEVRPTAGGDQIAVKPAPGSSSNQTGQTAGQTAGQSSQAGSQTAVAAAPTLAPSVKDANASAGTQPAPNIGSSPNAANVANAASGKLTAPVGMPPLQPPPSAAASTLLPSSPPHSDPDPASQGPAISLISPISPVSPSASPLVSPVTPSPTSPPSPLPGAAPAAKASPAPSPVASTTERKWERVPLPYVPGGCCAVL